MVGHIKGLLAKLRLNPTFYSGHSLCTGGATTVATASLRDWEVRSLGYWRSNMYWRYIREMMDMKVDSTGRMSHAPASITFNYSHPYPVKDKLWWTTYSRQFLGTAPPLSLQTLPPAPRWQARQLLAAWVGAPLTFF